MKKKVSILFILIIFFFIAVFFGLHIFVNLKGKDLLTAKLEQSLGRKASIGSISTSFPFNLEVKNIEVAGLLKVNRIVAGGGVIDIFRKNFHFSYLKITQPEINLERGLPQSVALPVAPGVKPAEAVNTPAPVIQPNIKPLSPKQKRFISSHFSVGRFIVSHGTINFTDKSLGENPLTVKFKDINLRINNLNIKDQRLRASSFSFETKVPWREGEEEGSIFAEGWVNLNKKSMKAKVNIKGIDGVYLYPYYAQWVDLDKARIESAKLQFTSDITGANNNLTAACHLELSDIVRKRRSAEELSQREERMTDAMLDAFKVQDQGKIILDFTYRTKMDRPEFDFGVVKTAFEAKLANGLKQTQLKPIDVAKLPVKLIKGTAKGVTDISKAAFAGTTSLGSELAKALKAAFTRQPKEKNY